MTRINQIKLLFSMLLMMASHNSMLFQ